MYNNIGKKIMGLAKFVAWIGIIGSIISGIFIISAGSQIGFLTIVLGSLVAWVGSFVLYGFGQLIDDTSSIRRTNNH